MKILKPLYTALLTVVIFTSLGMASSVQAGDFSQGILDTLSFAKNTAGLSKQTPTQVLVNAGNLLTGIAAALALFAVVLGGIMYIVSLGDEQRSARAKRILLFAIVGLIIAGIAALIINIAKAIAYGSPTEDLLDRIITIILNGVQILLAPAGVIAFGAFVFGGYLYITSIGDEARAGRAKRTMFFALLGLVFIGLAGIVVNAFIAIAIP